MMNNEEPKGLSLDTPGLNTLGAEEDPDIPQPIPIRVNEPLPAQEVCQIIVGDITINLGSQYILANGLSLIAKDLYTFVKETNGSIPKKAMGGVG